MCNFLTAERWICSIPCSTLTVCSRRNIIRSITGIPGGHATLFFPLRLILTKNNFFNFCGFCFFFGCRVTYVVCQKNTHITPPDFDIKQKNFLIRLLNFFLKIMSANLFFFILCMFVYITAHKQSRMSNIILKEKKRNYIRMYVYVCCCVCG